MLMSESMKCLLEFYGIDDIVKTAHIPSRVGRYNIWTKSDSLGRTYWGAMDFCGIDRDGAYGDKNLGWLEWDGNEVYLSVASAGKVPTLLKRAAGIMKYWKKQLKRNWPEIPFIIFASYSNNLEDREEDEEIFHSVTMRFFAVRDGDTLLDFEEMRNNQQPVMWLYCNS